jgi:hypothetical protein
MTAGIKLEIGKSYVCHQLPGTYFVGTVVAEIRDDLQGVTYAFDDYSWVQEMGRMSAFAMAVQSDTFANNVRIEYDGEEQPPRLVPACFIANARVLPSAVKHNVPLDT